MEGSRIFLIDGPSCHPLWVDSKGTGTLSDSINSINLSRKLLTEYSKILAEKNVNSIILVEKIFKLRKIINIWWL